MLQPEKEASQTWSHVSVVLHWRSQTLFSEKMLRPEQQDPQTFADGIETITITNKRVAQLYFDDGAVEYACRESHSHSPDPVTVRTHMY